MAIKSDFDVYNALDIFQNGTVLKDLKFGIGDGRLQYYIYNWRTAEVSASEVRCATPPGSRTVLNSKAECADDSLAGGPGPSLTERLG